MIDNKEFLRRYDAGEKFSEEELQDIVWGFREVTTNFGENLRWTRGATTIVTVDGRLFAIEWWEGLTEMQPNEYNEQPYEVKEVTEVVEVKKYVPLEDK